MGALVEDAVVPSDSGFDSGEEQCSVQELEIESQLEVPSPVAACVSNHWSMMPPAHSCTRVGLDYLARECAHGTGGGCPGDSQLVSLCDTAQEAHRPQTKRTARMYDWFPCLRSQGTQIRSEHFLL
jgi:hypothetical protein